MAFENASTNVAAAQMRNALTNLAETVTDPAEKKASPPPPLWNLAAGGGDGDGADRRPQTWREHAADQKHAQLFETEMDNFFSLFRRYLNDKAKGNAV
jgi:UTP--glucose-1-phosphate uridylyltransferase